MDAASASRVVWNLDRIFFFLLPSLPQSSSLPFLLYMDIPDLVDWLSRMAADFTSQQAADGISKIQQTLQP